MSDSVRPQRRQSTRIPHPWGSPGKNTGVGCHGLLQCMKVKREREVAQSCSTLPDPMDCSLPGSSTHGIFQARVLERSALALSDFSTKKIYIYQFSSVAQSCPTLCDPMNHSTPGLPVHHELPEFLKLMYIKSVMPSSHLILCHRLLILPPVPPSIRVFSNESTLRMR